ncbi:unnamed protein product [Linum trigynum]|uniref:Peptidase A1 domain-containing protein n=1 Tax=Linum trigynum TaxID=586398 RepID=A0AAV2C6K2_9ROSI
MRAERSSWMEFLFTAALILAAFSPLAVSCATTVLRLERTPVPLNSSAGVEKISAQDRARHARLFSGVANFSVYGSADSELYGIYYTKVKLGSPPQEFSLQIDTGSDLLWVSAKTCGNCPRSSSFRIELRFYDAAASSTAKVVPCSNKACPTRCTENGECSYKINYEDHSETDGYYVVDRIYLDSIQPDSTIATSSAPIVFGASTYQSGELGDSALAVDGMFGLGHGPLSPISQLSSEGVIPRVFSHCLKGEGLGGGTFVLGEISEPGMVYTPLVPAQPHYNLDLQSIAVNGELLPVDSSVFTTSTGRGTFIDSGTTLAYLVEEAYEPFISAVTAVVSPSATPILSEGQQCYSVTSSVSQVFPAVSFNFANSASLLLKPADYLHQSVMDVGGIWCVGFLKKPGVTILGDLVLKDKIVVYDLVHQQIGWTYYDCLKAVNVSVPKQRSSSASSSDMLLTSLPLAIIILSLQIFSVIVDQVNVN